jgi:glycosyltransferase involved in cell wall biosynthesis
MTESLLSNATSAQAPFDVICFCHLRWDFVFQRPQHLMTRFAQRGHVYIIEEPYWDADEPRLEISDREGNITVVTPHLGEGMDDTDVMPNLVRDFISKRNVRNYVSWFYTPMMLEWGRDLTPLATVYDCMDELSHFKNAPPELLPRERELFAKSDLVFTGGRSLYEKKKEQHHSVHAFPSSIDTKHFARAKEIVDDFAAHAVIEHPRVGFVAVIDERLDLDLLDKIAQLRPNINFILVGPVMKISESDLPRRDNIHYLGQQDYKDLPAILAGWDCAMMPFALNDATKYISPTKTPEFLAAGLPVVSTAVTDVVTPYGDAGLVHIAHSPEEFVAAIDEALVTDSAERRQKAADFLKDMSWDKTFESMYKLVSSVVSGGKQKAAEAA